MVTVTVKSISKTGTPNYSTPQAWEDASPASLVATDEIWQGEIDKVTDNYVVGGTFSLLFQSTTTSATQYKHLTCKTGVSWADDIAPRMAFDTSKGASLANSGTAQTINISENHVHISRLQVKTSAGGTAIILGATVGVRVDSIITESSSASAVPWGQGFGATDTVAVNSLFITTSTQATFVQAEDTDFINCVFAKPSDLTAVANAVTVASGTCNFINCAFMGCTNTATGAGTINFTTCATEDTSPPTGCTARTFTQADFIDDLNGTHDFRIDAASLFIDAGTDDVATALDPFGTVRTSGNYDIGAHELSAPVSETITPANETDSATAITVDHLLGMTQSVEVDSAGTGRPAFIISAAQSIEVAIAAAVSPSISITVDITNEVDSATLVTIDHALGMTQAFEVDSAAGTDPLWVIAVLPSTEVDSAVAVASDERIATLQTVEVDSASAAIPDERLAILQTFEVDSAAAVATDERISTTQTVEIDTAAAITSDTRVSTGQVIEVDIATAVDSDERLAITAASEVDAATAAFLLQGPVGTIGRVFEIDSAILVTIDRDGLGLRLPDTTTIDLTLSATVVDVTLTEQIIDLYY